MYGWREIEKHITKRRECHDCIKMGKVGRENKRNDHNI